MLDTLERAFYWFGSYLLEGDVLSHVLPRGAVDDDTLVTTSDDLMTGVEILGARKLVGAQEFDQNAAAVATILAAVMKAGNGKQHSFGISFRSSPHSVKRLLGEILEPSRNTARRIGVAEGSMDYFEDQLRALSTRCVEESVYLVVLTHRDGLTPSEKKRAAEWRVEANARARKGHGGMIIQEEFAQSPKIPPPALFPRHAAMVENLIRRLSEPASAHGADLLVRKLDAGHCLALMRRQIDAEDFDSAWRPRFIGKSSAAGVAAPRGAGKKEVSTLLPPPIGRQLVSDGYKEMFGDAEMAKRGRWYYGSIMLEVPPENPESPAATFDRLAAAIGRQIPWSVGIEISPNGASSRGMDQLYAGFVGGFGDWNKKVRAAWIELKRRHNGGDYVAAMRLVFSTWAASERECVEHLSFLRSTLESWESCVVSNETGSPALAALCSAAGLTKRNPAPYLPGPIAETARMLPMFRPASVWNAGQLVAHTTEGRPYPVAFGSSMQNFWGVLGFAPSGTGKSFTLSMINFGILFSAGLEEIPPLVVIDVGPGSSYPLRLARSMLPENRKHEITWMRIRNDKDHTVNPFDTQLGCDEPTEVDRDFQVAVVATLCPTLGPEGDRFISIVIKEAYRRLGRKSPDCRAWQSSYDPQLHDLLVSLGYQFSDKSRVWDVVDWLFDQGQIDAANRAQRYAVPRLSDLVQAAQAKTIQDQFGGEDAAKTPGGEKMIAVFIRNITSAQAEYALISGFTRYDIGNAKAMAIDLEEVVGSMTSEEGKRRSAIMFLFARRLGARNFFLRWDELKSIVPERYRAYQEQRVNKIGESLKFLEYDEKHYTTGIESVDRQLAVDLRVGRKYKTVTMMFSQMLADFPRATVDNCYTYLIMGKGSAASARELQEAFGLSDSEIGAIESKCTRPGVLFGLFKTKVGDTSQVLQLTAGPFCQWAFTSGKDDGMLREELIQRVGDVEALRMLAKVFPEGSAMKALELYRQRRDVGDRDTRSEAQIFADKVLAAIQRGDSRMTY